MIGFLVFWGVLFFLVNAFFWWGIRNAHKRIDALAQWMNETKCFIVSHIEEDHSSDTKGLKDRIQSLERQLKHINDWQAETMDRMVSAAQALIPGTNHDDEREHRD